MYFIFQKQLNVFVNPLQIETTVMPVIFQTAENGNSGLNFADLQTGKYYFEIVIETRHCQQLRDALTAVLDQRRRPVVARDGQEAVRMTVLCTSEDERRRLSSVLADFPSAKLMDVRECSASGLRLPAAVDNRTVERGTEDKLSRLRVRISQLVGDAEVRERLLGDLPTSYELYDEGMLLLPAACLRSMEFQELREEVLNVICDVFRQVSYKKI